MKIGPVSGDLLVKVGIGLAIFAGLGMVIWTIKGKASAAMGQAANAINPASPDNVVYTGVNSALGGGDKNWTVGGWLYDLTHDEYDPNAGTQTNKPTNQYWPTADQNALTPVLAGEVDWTRYDAMGNRY